VSDGGLRAAIFDMDGLLVDSEPLWREAEIEILGGLGVPLAGTSCRQTKGMFVGEVTRYWFARFPWSGPTVDEVAVRVVDRVIELVLQQGRLLPGVHAALNLCERHGQRLGIASSSEYRLIEAVLGHFGLEGRFRVVHSAQDEPYGKPHPAVYLSTAQRLGTPPECCVALEDAPAGVLAAKAARMACVAVPEPAERAHPIFGIADLVLGSLAELDDAAWDRVADAHVADPLAAPGAQAQAPEVRA